MKGHVPNLRQFRGDLGAKKQIGKDRVFKPSSSASKMRSMASAWLLIRRTQANPSTTRWLFMI